MNTCVWFRVFQVRHYQMLLKNGLEDTLYKTRRTKVPCVSSVMEQVDDENQVRQVDDWIQKSDNLLFIYVW